MSLRQNNNQAGAQKDVNWATTATLGVIAVATLVCTRSATDVPIVLGPILVALGFRAQRD